MLRLKASKVLRYLQGEVVQLTPAETEQGIHFSSGDERVRDTTHCMKAVQKHTSTFSSFTSFFLHSYLVYM